MLLTTFRWIGVAILVVLFRNLQTIYVEDLDQMKG